MKKIVLFAALMILLAGCIGEKNTEKNGGGKESVKILMVISPKDFSYEQYHLVKEKLEKENVKVVVLSKKKVAKADNGYTVSVDINGSLANTAAGRINITEYAAYVFIGGDGISTYVDDKIDITDMVIASMVKYGIESKVLASIGNASLIIAKAFPEVLKGKNMTGDPSIENELKSMGINYIDQGVVVDGNIITAKNEEYAQEFVDRILDAIH